MGHGIMNTLRVDGRWMDSNVMQFLHDVVGQSNGQGGGHEWIHTARLSLQCFVTSSERLRLFACKNQERLCERERERERTSRGLAPTASYFSNSASCSSSPLSSNKEITLDRT